MHDIIPWSGHANYAASKGDVMMLMKTMSQELSPHKIRVNSISPGAIKTPINRAAWETPEAEESLLKLIPYKEDYSPYGTAWEYFDHDQARSRAYRWNEDGMVRLIISISLLCKERKGNKGRIKRGGIKQ